jgi:hypothetical protein
MPLNLNFFRASVLLFFQQIRRTETFNYIVDRTMDTEAAIRDSKPSLMKPRRTSTDFVSWTNKHVIYIPVTLNLIFSEHLFCIFLNKSQRAENFPS